MYMKGYSIQRETGQRPAHCYCEKDQVSGLARKFPLRTLEQHKSDVEVYKIIYE